MCQSQRLNLRHQVICAMQDLQSRLQHFCSQQLYQNVIIANNNLIRQQNNIKMTSSLPKIKTLTNNSESGSQKQLKFIKIKLNTSESEADIRQRFKSVKTERLSKLQRYSTVHQQREYKKEKIQLNLLQRKLLAGTYDQATERSNDLNSFKQQTDSYKTQSILRQNEIQKLRQATQDLRRQIEKYDQQRKRKQQVINKIQRKCENQKLKTETTVSERNCLQYMINQREVINHFLEGKLNQNRIYLSKLKSIVRQTDSQLRQSTENMRNLTTKLKKINNQLQIEQKNRQQIIQSKQIIISKRKDDQKLREQRSIEYKKSLDEAQVQIQQKGLADLCKSVIANIFFQKYNQITQHNLEQRYQVMENMYRKICSYQKFDPNEPKNLVQRFRNLKQQTSQYEGKVKNLQSTQLKLQKGYNQLLQKFNESRIVSKKPLIDEKIQNKNDDKFQKQQMAEIQYQKQILKNTQQTAQIFAKIDSIGSWSQRYAREMNIKTRNNFNWEDISRNILNILKVVQTDKQNIEAWNKKNQINNQSI